MADIAAGDVTYTLVNKQVLDSSYKKFVFTIAFGDSSLTYPSGGIPLTKASLGCPNAITNLTLFGDGSADGMIYKYDAANNKIRMYRSAGFTPAGTNALVTGTISAGVIAVTAGTAGDAVTNNAGVLESTGGQDLAVATQTFTGSTPTFTGTAVAAGVLVETTSAPAAVTLYAEVVGW